MEIEKEIEKETKRCREIDRERENSDKREEKQLLQFDLNCTYTILKLR